MLGGGVMVLPAAPILKRSRDTEIRYRPDSELFYLTGAVDSGVVAVLGDTDETPFILFVPERDPAVELWSGPRLGPEEAKEILGADACFPLHSLEDRLPSILQRHNRVLFRLGSDSRVEGLVQEGLRWARGPGSRKGEGIRAVVDPGNILDGLRLVKEPEEIEQIRRATSLTASAFRETLGRAGPGMGEWEVEAMLDSAFRKAGASGPAFPTIVGSGPNACVLHYVENQAVIGPDDMVLLDGGAELGLYAGDVTRTFPANSRFTPAQRDIYDLVLRAHSRAVGMVRPGATIAGMHEAAQRELTRGLVELGVLEGELDELMVAGGAKSFFPHQTSHWLGLDVHDVGDYAVSGDPRVLEAGMVLTIEPGLYFPVNPDSPTHPFHGLGVRIEDDILVTEGGSENLTGSLPVAAEDVEALVGADLRG
jgi:Xaa-Pro aminopeptidase